MGRVTEQQSLIKSFRNTEKLTLTTLSQQTLCSGLKFVLLQITFCCFFFTFAATQIDLHCFTNRHPVNWVITRLFNCVCHSHMHTDCYTKRRKYWLTCHSSRWSSSICLLTVTWNHKHMSNQVELYLSLEEQFSCAAEIQDKVIHTQSAK